MSADRTDLDLRLTAQEMRFVSGGIPLLSGAEAELVAVIDADLANNRFTFSRNTLRLNAISVGLDGWVELDDDAVVMDLTAGCDKVQFKDVLSLIPAFYTREFKNLTAGGELSMALWAKGEMRGSALPAFELKTEVRDGSFRSSLPKAVTGINIAAKVANPGGVMDKTVVDLSKFGLKMAGNSVSATFYATNLVSDPVFRATAAGRVDLGAVKEVYPLEKGVELGGQITADLKVSGRMSDIEKNRYEKLGAQGTFTVEELGLTLPSLPAVHIRRAAATITPAAMTLGEFGVTVGKSDLAANGQLTGYIGYLLRGDMLSGRLYVKSELLDLNEIMEAMPASSEPAEGEAVAAEPMQAVEVPRNLNLSLNTDLRKVLFGKMTVSDISGEMSVAGGVLSLDRLRLGVFGGKATASGSYSTAADPAKPALKLNADIAGASFQKTFEELEMVQKLVPIFAKTGGDYSLALDMRTSLDSQMSPDLQTLTATGEIRSANIHVQNIEAFDALAKALNNDDLRKIEAKDVTIRFAIRDGRITTQPFDLKLGSVGINLSGSTGLDQTIDYTAKVAIPGGKTLQSIGVGIGGTFSSPKITLGVKEAAEEAVKNIVDEQIQKLTGSESLSEEIQKQAENLRAEAKRTGRSSSRRPRASGRNSSRRLRRRALWPSSPPKRPGTNWSPRPRSRPRTSKPRPSGRSKNSRRKKSDRNARNLCRHHRRHCDGAPAYRPAPRFRTAPHHRHHLGPVVPAGGRGGLRPCGRGLAGDARRGGAGDLRPLRRGEHLRRVAVVAADSRTRRACRRRGGRRRCPGLRMGGPLRQSRDRRLLRGGVCRQDFAPFDLAGSRVSAYVLYALMFCVGITLGNDRTLAGRVRRLDPRLALLPVATAVGTLAGAALAAPLLAEWSLTDSLAVGAGFGYYSLSSIFIADFRGPELATIALLCNVMREIFTLLAAPLVARWCGPLAAVSIGGATTFDTTLPIITQAAGRPYAVVSVFHGCVLDFSVPFLVTFFCIV